MAKKAYIGAVILPIGYTLVDYIESSGTQYINTGVKPNNNTRVVCDFQMLKTGVGQSVFGAFTFDSNYSVIDAYLLQLPVENAFVSWYGAGDAVSFNSSISASSRHLCDKNKNSCKIDTSTVSNATHSFTSSYPIYIFCGNLMNSVFEPASVRVWSAKIYDGTTIVRNYIPCVNADGVVGMYDTVTSTFYKNAGSGAFKAGSSLDSSVAREVKKMYIGIDGTARNIKKAYIGIGGVARPCWANGLEYYGAVSSLSSGVQELAATTVGNYALFGGGLATTGVVTDIVNSYNKSLTKGSPTKLARAVCSLAATSIGNYALFAGGAKAVSSGSATTYTTVTAYDASLTRTSPTVLPTACRELAATAIGDYALFSGGDSSSAVTTYNKSLTRGTATSFTSKQRQGAATTVGNYALFGGGCSSLNERVSTVHAYNASLTQSTPAALSTARRYIVATTVGNYAIFGGGFDGYDGGTKVTDAYSTSLTHSTPTSLSVARQQLAATSVGGYALFGGGLKANTKYSGDVDAYSSSLVRTIPTGISTRRSLAATTVGNYALFAGGYNGYGTPATVEAYIVE